MPASEFSMLHSRVASSKRTVRNREISQEHRDKVKAQTESKITRHNLLNGVCGAFSPIAFELTEFRQLDKPLVGDRKEKNRLASLNSRNRAKLMLAELDSRLKVLEAMVEPEAVKYDFDFPSDEITEIQLKIKGETFTNGKFIL